MADPSEHSIKHWNDTTEEVNQALDKRKLDKCKAACQSLNPESVGGKLWKLIKHIAKIKI